MANTDYIHVYIFNHEKWKVKQQTNLTEQSVPHHKHQNDNKLAYLTCTGKLITSIKQHMKRCIQQVQPSQNK